jgi:hypothetical protein
MLHILTSPHLVHCGVKVIWESRIPASIRATQAFDRFALGAVAQSCPVEKRLLDEIAIGINEVRRNPFSL